MPRFYVITPEYGEVVPVTDEGQGPMEYGCDVIEIEALTAADAKALGVRAMLAKPREYRWFRHSDGSPFSGVRVELVSDDELVYRTHAKYRLRSRQ
jgi:hypothetical protein